ncbi:dUTP diphosphatase [Paenibacillus rigui]|uniref:dUTPase n=1 Tax=Paenibacillus rigui TaxID=554312 RepID=A0A229UKR2_9BACL|nr:dUTP diphosphatase [Paenibacillus rigui]OXM83986.1 dUTPase [Paenibacillus rigui]
MNLSKLFEMQRELDEKIIKEKGLQDMDRLPYLILALQVELGECANEWRGFKYWSNEREPRTSVADTKYKPITGDPLEGFLSHKVRNPLLEEYVDCLIFILSIGLTQGYNESIPALGRNVYKYKTDEITSHFSTVFRAISDFEFRPNEGDYMRIWMSILGLGEMLGFTCEQIEQAYMDLI